jgi:hypothetical protein
VVKERVLLYDKALFLFYKKQFMEIKVSVPSSLKEVKLKNYQDYLLIKNPTSEDILKCILNIDQKELGKIKATDVDFLMTHISKLFKKKQELIPTFKLKGVEYGFIPKLDDITYGENKDVTAYVNDWGTMHKAMAVLFRPIKKKQGTKYLIEDYEGSHKYSELMKEIPLDVVMGAMVFFYNLTSVLLSYIPNFLEKEIKKEEQILGVASKKNGEAIVNCIALLRDSLQGLQKLQNYPFISA